MTTERLYYDQPCLLEFDARVLEVARRDGRPAVVLDRTAFYPTGGGQPHDTGRLGDRAVIDVLAEDETVFHLLDGEPGFQAGERVQGRVDEARRRDHLQQHSGQHLLSAAFVREAGAETRSFHLGAVTSTIDLTLPPDRLGELRRVEELANRVIREDREVAARIVEEEEASTLPLRKEIPVRGRVRVVSIADFDMSPCGGTHARRTTEIGLLAILGCERHRQGSRVEFVAGDRVRRLLHALGGEAEAMGALLSAPRGERVAALAKLLEERRDVARERKALGQRVAGLEAAALSAAQPPPGPVRSVLAECGEEEAAAIARALADLGRVAVLGHRDGRSARVLVAGPGQPDVGKILREVAASFEARGGGGGRFAQAGGIDPQVLDRLLEELAGRLADAMRTEP